MLTYVYKLFYHATGEKNKQIIWHFERGRKKRENTVACVMMTTDDFITYIV